VGRSDILVLNSGHCTRDTRLSHERLTEHGFSVLTPSRPGYDSTPSSGGKSAQAAADALAALLDTLQIKTVDVIGISAAGPTELALTQRHPNRVRKLILESAVTTDLDEQTKRGSRLVFGRAEKFTWTFMHLMLKLFPLVMIKALLHDLTVLDVDEVVRRMSENEIAFIKRMLQTARSGTGFINDIEHRVDKLLLYPCLFWSCIRPMTELCRQRMSSEFLMKSKHANFTQCPPIPI
jgi:pimeloyl-ACP methyl ester carboxylesterase